MYCLLLQSLQSDYIEENEEFSGYLQVGIILKLFWRIQIGSEESYFRVVLLLETLFITTKCNGKKR